MNEIALWNRQELNNNGDLKSENFLSRNARREYASSASSSDISEDVEMSSVQDVMKDPEHSQDNPIEEQPDVRRFRSMSDGAPISPDIGSGNVFEVFPSLPNSVLEKMRLLGDNSREMKDEDLEHKFVSLSLAFTIDGATIKDRCNRQRRYRDQTETNLNVEIDRLIEKANKLQPLCIDAETTELLTGLLAHVDIIIRAAAHAAISAERFGAVQHELRLSESVQLMINYVNALKEQREASKRQLEYTKKLFQDTNSSEPSSIRQRNTHAHLNGRGITRRRASIATITQPQDMTNKVPQDMRRIITRRTSELTIRGNLFRTPRPSRMESSMVKICEGALEKDVSEIVDEENDVDIEDNNSSQCNDDSFDTVNLSNRKVSQVFDENITTMPLKHRLLHRMKKIGSHTEKGIKDWISSGTSNEVFCFCALMCFSLSIITMGNILVELEYARRGVPLPFYFWNFSLLWTDNSVVEYSNEAASIL